MASVLSWWISHGKPPMYAVAQYMHQHGAAAASAQIHTQNWKLGRRSNAAIPLWLKSGYNIAVGSSAELLITSSSGLSSRRVPSQRKTFSMIGIPRLDDVRSDSG